jgi:hypothetical protein
MTDTCLWKQNLNSFIFHCRSPLPHGLRRVWHLKARTLYHRFESHSRHGCMSEFFCVALSCVGRGLETGRTLVQGVPTKCLNGFTFAEAKSQRAKCRQQLQQHIPFLLFHTKFRGIKTVSNNAIWFHGRFFSVFMKHPVQSREWCALILLTPLDFKHPIKARS